MPQFDAYTATARLDGPEKLLSAAYISGAEMKQREGYFNGFGNLISLRTEHGEYASVGWGGQNEGWARLEVKGSLTPVVVERLREAIPDHRVTRVDSAHDVDKPGAWDDFPEDGRTLYLGAPSSPIRARLYEKGKQPEYRQAGKPDWTRLELQISPQKDAREVYSKLSATEVWGASKYTRALAARVLESELAAYPPGTVRRDSQRDRAIRFMCEQYGAHLMSLKDDLGSWDCVGLTLAEIIREVRSAREQ
ncbi:hypothetical protein R77591_04981 [Ralstonia mannitolilytica]|uniref:Replication initiation protein-like C-terminal domain-containing protein n=1 Tax=Ralstonia mannitolilytica TaxID=105219 RepID=A0AAD2B8N8_9RALS|nr:replication initiation factor domain-containing protein [Ralstonia mannitolilytica]CAJ0698410.1 hypothetical protein R77591_04981 [Ralstonia mannitolilytica]